MYTKFSTITGVVIRQFDAKEADRVVHLITTEGSKLAAIAKSVKRANSRKAHALDLGNTIEIKLTGPGELQMISEIKLIDQHLQFKRDYVGLTFIQLVCEIVSTFVQEEQTEAAYYRNLDNLLSITDPKRYALLAAALILRYMYVSGNLPRLEEDLLNGELLSDEAIFALPEIGYTSDQRSGLGTEVSARIIKTQRYILHTDFANIDKVSLSIEEQLEMLQLHVRWLENSVHKQLRAAGSFIEGVLAS